MSANESFSPCLGPEEREGCWIIVCKSSGAPSSIDSSSGKLASDSESSPTGSGLGSVLANVAAGGDVERSSTILDSARRLFLARCKGGGAGKEGGGNDEDEER